MLPHQAHTEGTEPLLTGCIPVLLSQGTNPEYGTLPGLDLVRAQQTTFQGTRRTTPASLLVEQNTCLRGGDTSRHVPCLDAV